MFFNPSGTPGKPRMYILGSETVSSAFIMTDRERLERLIRAGHACPGSPIELQSAATHQFHCEISTA